MRIWELSKKSLLSIDTIRYYEKRGLIKSEKSINSSNDYKNYNLDCLKRLEFIKIMKQLGLTLSECKQGLEDMDNNKMTCESKQKFINNKITEINKKISELEKIKWIFTELLTSTDKNNVKKVKKMLEE